MAKIENRKNDDKEIFNWQDFLGNSQSSLLISLRKISWKIQTGILKLI